MIILSGVLVVVAIALLVTGIVTGNTGHEVLGLDGLKLIYVSIGVSIISALCLAIGVFVRRKELFGGGVTEVTTTKTATTRRVTRPAKAKARVGAGDDTPVVPISPAATEVPAETSVFVIPGRKRYHLETCRQLAGRDKEELTFVEAREEGFTACTACLPDTALAARAAATETAPVEAPEPDDTRPTESLATASETTELPRPAEIPADVTRTDLPAVSSLDDLDRAPEPAATSPAADELTDGPTSTPAVEPADTTRFDEVAEAPEEASEPLTERPLARSRSFFEPLGGEDQADEDQANEEPAEVADEEAVAEPEAAEAAELEDEPAEDTPAAEEPVTAEEPEEPAAEDERDTTATDADADDADAGSDATRVRILSGTKRYHRPDCALIEDIAEDADDLETLTQAEAKDRGCTPCLVCQPDKDSSDI